MIVIEPWRKMNDDLWVLRVVAQVPQSDGSMADILLVRCFARSHSYDVQTSDCCILARGHAETLNEARIEAVIQTRSIVGEMLERLCESALINT